MRGMGVINQSATQNIKRSKNRKEKGEREYRKRRRIRREETEKEDGEKEECISISLYDHPLLHNHIYRATQGLTRFPSRRFPLLPLQNSVIQLTPYHSSSFSFTFDTPSAPWYVV